MKKLKYLALAPALLAFAGASAQNNANLTISDEHPSAGEKIHLTYNPAGTIVAGKEDMITAEVFFMDNKDYPAADVDLKKTGTSLSGDFTIPATAKAFYIKIGTPDVTDNNNEKGFIYQVYKDKQPVEGAYASTAYMIWSGMGASFAGIKMDKPLAAELYKKEFAQYPGSLKDYGYNYYFFTASLKDAGSLAIVDQKIAALEKSDDEKDLLQATSLLTREKKTKESDSLSAVIKSRFPNGKAAQNELGSQISKEKDLAKKDSLFKIYIAKYPDSGTEKNSMQDYFRLQLAAAYLKNADFEKYNSYVSQLKDKANLPYYTNNVTYDWAKKGEHLEEAEKLSKQSLDMMEEKIKKPVPGSFQSEKSALKNAKSLYDMYADTYAFILYKEKKYNEALKYQQDVYTRNTENDPEITLHYALTLSALGQYAKSKEVIEKNIKAGKSSEALKEELKNDYVKIKGSDKGYDTYIATLDNTSKTKFRAEMAKKMINQAAPLFALKDLKGDKVALADLKGKIVIVDFWATWCGPCKASFPGMQLAVNKYKDNPNVVFLFVDCWENGDNYIDGVKKFIAESKYTFNVLVDEKGADGRQSKVVDSFGVNGIPTKFIIDKGGNIRFKYVGYSGTPEALVDEVTAMIDLATNPEGLPGGQKVSMLKE